jgi:hypothetical protein
MCMYSEAGLLINGCKGRAKKSDVTSYLKRRWGGWGQHVQPGGLPYTSESKQVICSNSKAAMCAVRCCLQAGGAAELVGCLAR